MQENARKLNQLLIQKQTLGFEERELVRELIQEQKELEKFLEQVRREKKAADMTHEEQSPTSDEELLKKQEELQELFDKVLDEETKKIIAELERSEERNVGKECGSKCRYRWSLSTKKKKKKK